MKNIFKYIALAAVMAFGLSACVEKAPEYVPADAAETIEAYFASTLPATYELSPDSYFFTVNVNRVPGPENFVVSIASKADPLFLVPSAIELPGDTGVGELRIEYDPALLEEGVNYEFELSISDNQKTTIYGVSSYKFTAGIPSAEVWEQVKGTCFVENIWNMYNSTCGTHTFDCYTEKLQGHDVYRIVNPFSVYYDAAEKRYCNPYFIEDASESGVWPEELEDDEDYYLILDMEGYYWEDLDPEKGEVFVFASPNLKVVWEDGPFSVISSAVSPSIVSSYSIPMPLGKYDPAKKCINLGDIFFEDDGGIYCWPTYAGVAYSYLYFDKALMKEDYNSDSYFGSSERLFMGYAESNLFADASGKPQKFNQNLRVDTSYDPKKDKTTLYYLTDYFGKGYNLAFTGPILELLKDGAEISGVANEQEVGASVLGYKLNATVKKGTVTWAEDDDYPTFTFKIDVNGVNAEGATLNFGKFEETFYALDTFTNYSAADIVGGDKDDYIGEWTLYAQDPDNDESEWVWDIEIADGGTDADGVEHLKVYNLMGYDEPGDVVDLEYEDDFGIAFFYAQPCGFDDPLYGLGPMVIMPGDKSAYYDDEGIAIACGITDDGNLAFVSPYAAKDISTFYMVLTTGAAAGYYVDCVVKPYAVYDYTGLTSANAAPANYYKQFTTSQEKLGAGKSTSGRKLTGASRKNLKRGGEESSVKVPNLTPAQNATVKGNGKVLIAK